MAKGIIIDIGFKSDIDQYLKNLESQLKAKDFDKMIGLSDAFDAEYKKVSELIKRIRQEVDSLSGTDVSTINKQLNEININSNKLSKAFGQLLTALPNDFKDKVNQFADINTELKEIMDSSSGAAEAIKELNKEAKGNIKIVDNAEAEKLTRIYANLRSLREELKDPISNKKDFKNINDGVGSLVRSYERLNVLSERFKSDKSDGFSREIHEYVNELSEAQSIISRINKLKPGKEFNSAILDVNGVKKQYSEVAREIETAINEVLNTIDTRMATNWSRAESKGIDLSSKLIELTKKSEGTVKVGIELNNQAKSGKTLANQVKDAIAVAQETADNNPLVVEVSLASSTSSRVNQKSINEVAKKINELEANLSNTGKKAAANQVKDIKEDIADLVENMKGQMSDALEFNVRVLTAKAEDAIRTFMASAKQEIQSAKFDIIPNIKINPENVKSQFLDVFTKEETAKATESMLSAIDEHINKLTKSSKDLKKALGEIVKQDSFSKDINQIVGDFNKLNEQLVNANTQLKEFSELLDKAGKNRSTDNIQKAATEMVDTAITATENTQDSHSPSKVAEKLGEYWGQGYAEGIADTQTRIKNAVRVLVETGKLAVNELLGDKDFAKISDDVYDDFVNKKPLTKQALGFQKTINELDNYKEMVKVHGIALPKDEQLRNNVLAMQKKNLEDIRSGAIDAIKALDNLRIAMGGALSNQNKETPIVREDLINKEEWEWAQKIADEYFKELETQKESKSVIEETVQQHKAITKELEKEIELEEQRTKVNINSIEGKKFQDQKITEVKTKVKETKTEVDKLNEAFEKFKKEIADQSFDLRSNAGKEQLNSYIKRYAKYWDLAKSLGVAPKGLDQLVDDPNKRKKFEKAKEDYVESIKKQRAEANATQSKAAVQAKIEETKQTQNATSAEKQLTEARKNNARQTEAEAALAESYKTTVNQGKRKNKTKGKNTRPFDKTDALPASAWSGLFRITESENDSNKESANKLLKLYNDYKTSPAKDILDEIFKTTKESNLSGRMKTSIFNYIDKLKKNIDKEAKQAIEESAKEPPKMKTLIMNKGDYKKYVKEHHLVPTGGSDSIFESNFDKHLKGLEEQGLAQPPKGRRRGWKIKVEVEDKDVQKVDNVKKEVQQTKSEVDKLNESLEILKKQIDSKSFNLRTKEGRNDLNKYFDQIKKYENAAKKLNVQPKSLDEIIADPKKLDKFEKKQIEELQKLIEERAQKLKELETQEQNESNKTTQTVVENQKKEQQAVEETNKAKEKSKSKSKSNKSSDVAQNTEAIKQEGKAATDASKMKQAFADANVSLRESIEKSLPLILQELESFKGTEYLSQYIEFLENLYKVLNALSNENKTTKVAESIRSISEAVNNIQVNEEFFSALNSVLGRSDELRDLANIAKQYGALMTKGVSGLLDEMSGAEQEEKTPSQLFAERQRSLSNFAKTNLSQWISDIQNSLNEHQFTINTELNKAAIMSEFSKVAGDFADEFNKQTGAQISSSDMMNAFRKAYSESEQNVKLEEQYKYAETLLRVDDEIAAKEKEISNTVQYINEMRQAGIDEEEAINKLAQEYSEIMAISDSVTEYDEQRKIAEEISKINQAKKEGKLQEEKIIKAHQKEEELLTRLFENQEILTRKAEERKKQTIEIAHGEALVEDYLRGQKMPEQFINASKSLSKSVDNALRGDANAANDFIDALKEIKSLWINLQNYNKTGFEFASDEELTKLQSVYSAVFDTIINKINSVRKQPGVAFSNLFSSVVKNAEQLQSELSLSNLINTDTNAFNTLSLSIEDVIKLINELGLRMKEIIVASSDDVNKLGNDMGMFLIKNSSIPREYKKQIEELIAQLNALKDKFGLNNIPKEDLKEIKDTFGETTSKLREMGYAGKSVFDKIGVSLKNSIIQVTRMYLSWYRWISYIRQGITEVINMDTALTKMSYTMNVTDAQLRDMSNQMVQMAKDLSSSISNIQQIYQIYANLQTTQEELEKTARPTAILANLSGVDASTAADQIQGVLNQFNLTADAAEHVVDVYDKISASIKVDYSKGIAGMAEAVQNVGNYAAQAGVSFEQLSAIVAKVMEKTRQEGASIGNALRTNNIVPMYRNVHNVNTSKTSNS